MESKSQHLLLIWFSVVLLSACSNSKNLHHKNKPAEPKNIAAEMVQQYAEITYGTELKLTDLRQSRRLI